MWCSVCAESPQNGLLLEADQLPRQGNWDATQEFEGALKAIYKDKWKTAFEHTQDRDHNALFSRKGQKRARYQFVQHKVTLVFAQETADAAAGPIRSNKEYIILRSAANVANQFLVRHQHH